MHVRPGTDVVSQVPAQVIGIFVEHDVVRIPEPVAAVGNVIGSYGKVISAEPEALRISSRQPPAMLWPEAACEVPTLPGMIQVIVRVVAPGAMPDPFSVGVNVRCVGMAFLITEMSVILGGGTLIGRTMFRSAWFRCPLLLRMLLRWPLCLGLPLRRVRHGSRFGPSVGNVHSTLGRPLMFIVLRHCRQRKKYACRQTSENVLHHFQTSTIPVCEVFCGGG